MEQSYEIQEAETAVQGPVLQSQEEVSTLRPFIQANTIQCSLEEIKHQHIIPSFVKDNECLISQVDFIEATSSIVEDIYKGEHILKPNIRLSHPIKGRVPEARDKAAKDLLEHEKTLYYERCAFVIEVPSVYDEIDGSILSLCAGGIKAYNLDNLYNKKGADEHFKVFIGFKNTVCTNLCIWTDGYMSDLKVQDIGQLKACIRSLCEGYNANFQIQQLRSLIDHNITELQFATLVGKCRIYNYLPYAMKKEMPELLLSDTQVNIVCKDYYRDDSTCKDGTGEINLWKLYNLFTSANKSTYIDNFLDRSVNAYTFVEQIKFALQKREYNWFLN